MATQTTEVRATAEEQRLLEVFATIKNIQVAKDDWDTRTLKCFGCGDNAAVLVKSSYKSPIGTKGGTCLACLYEMANEA